MKERAQGWVEKYEGREGKIWKEQKIYKGRPWKILKKDENMKELGKQYKEWEK